MQRLAASGLIAGRWPLTIGRCPPPGAPWLNKTLPHLLSAGLLLIMLLAAFALLEAYYRPLDNRLRDLLMQAHSQEPVSGRIALVAIDEASLDALGQWPWERTKLAQILRNLDAAGALLIGLDMFFTEPDRSSPDRLARQQGIEGLDLPNYDQLLAQTLEQTPVVLGYGFDLTQPLRSQRRPSGALALPPDQAGLEALAEARGLIPNLELLQQAALTEGFLNYLPDADGMIRQLPLLMRYQGQVYPSLSLALLQLLEEEPGLQLLSGSAGLQGIKLGERLLPTDAQGNLQLHFYGPGGRFPRLSAGAVYAGQFDPAEVAGKVILLGATATGLADLRPTPLDSAMPGVEIHATALENLLSGRHLHRPDWLLGAEALLLGLLALLLALSLPHLSAPLILLLMLAGLGGFIGVADYLLFQHGLLLNLLFPSLALLLLTLSGLLLNYARESRQRQRIRARFAQKVSAAVVDDILQHEDEGVLIGRNREISIFFSDVRGFTGLTETLGAPEKVIDLLNIYMTPMVEEVIRTRGTLDKFIGDAIMAYWNAPNTVAEHAVAAVTTALRQLERMQEVNARLQAKYAVEIDIGIGINSGLAIVGEMGSAGRSDYTIIGDSVNLASRLEGLCKKYGCRIVISEFTSRLLNADFCLRELDLVRVKGKQEPVRIFEVLGWAANCQSLQAQLQASAEALQAYRQARFGEALAQFQALSEEADAPLYRLYRERCTYFLANPPADFDGVFVHESK
ncbi:MAG: adenylate/guanylate cyclase domain-containing protein [Gammaproteobacteria bacterium]|nr:adenylate/guanylate cyclase domain-containing protein [Gammaproteobacteria bacterium]